MADKHILIVDDDTRLRQLLKSYLAKNGFIVSEASNANDAEDLLKYIKPNAIVMDIMMPQKNGDILTQELRQKGLLIPILILTARGDSASRIAGLEAGADDYLPKPFEPKELVLRLNNLIKHQIQVTETTFTFGPYTYQLQTGVLKQGDTNIPLTGAEQALLTYLIQQNNQIVSRETLAEQLNLENIRTVDVQITRLRKKLETGTTEHIIQTIRGKGYRLIST